MTFLIGILIACIATLLVLVLVQVDRIHRHQVKEAGTARDLFHLREQMQDLTNRLWQKEQDCHTYLTTLNEMRKVGFVHVPEDDEGEDLGGGWVIDNDHELAIQAARRAKQAEVQS